MNIKHDIVYSRKVLQSFAIIFIVLKALQVSAAKPVIIDEKLSRHIICRDMEYIEDRDRNLTIDDIVNKPLKWNQSERDFFNFGFTESAYWFRFTVKNTIKTESLWNLEINNPLLIKVYLFIPDGRGKFKAIKTGTDHTFHSRDVVYRNFVFSIKDKPGQKTFYIRIFTQSPFNFSVFIWSHKAFIEKINTELPMYWIFYGLMIVMLLYNLFIFFSLRDKAYIYCSFFILFLTLIDLHLNGFAFQHLWPNAVWWEKHYPLLLIAFAVISVAYYIKEFIDSKVNFPVLDRISVYVIIIPGFILGIMSLFLIEEKYFRLLFLIWLAYVAIISILVIVYANLIRNRASRFLAFGFMAFIIGVVIDALQAMGIIKISALSTYSHQLGTSMMIIIFSLGLADRINILNKKIRKAEQKYRYLVEKSNDIIFSLDEEMNFLSVNRALWNILGFSEKDIISTNFMDLIDESRYASKQIVKEIIRGYIEDLKAHRKNISFKADFKTRYADKPKELTVKLEYTEEEGVKDRIHGNAFSITDDITLQYIVSERHVYSIENYISSANLLSTKLTRNLSRFLREEEINSIKVSLREILVNAIEHGNLNIKFDDKTAALKRGNYLKFIIERQKNLLYRDKKVHIEYTLTMENVIYSITDEGEGFDHKSTMRTAHERSNSEMLGHGRGLLFAQAVFDDIRFNEKGNHVMLIKYFNGDSD